MIPKFDIDDYRGKYVMHCDTKEKARIFCDYLASTSRKWYDNTSYEKETYWHMYNTEMCYSFNSGQFATKEWYEKEGYTVLEFDDFDWGERKTMENKLKNFLENLTDEQKNELAEIIDKKKETGYEKPKEDETYYFSDMFGVVRKRRWANTDIDNNLFENAFCNTIESVAEVDARADLLGRKLRRFAKLNNKAEIDWENDKQLKFFISFFNGKNKVNFAYTEKITNVTYFSEKETAERAIKLFKEELEWYFTEYL